MTQTLSYTSIFQIFEPQAYPTDAAQLRNWGNAELGVLLDHYGAVKNNHAGVSFVLWSMQVCIWTTNPLYHMYILIPGISGL